MSATSKCASSRIQVKNIAVACPTDSIVAISITSSASIGLPGDRNLVQRQSSGARAVGTNAVLEDADTSAIRATTIVGDDNNGRFNQNPDTEVALDLQAITSDIASLKHDLAALTRHLKLAASEKTRTAAQSAVEQISDEASRAYENLTSQGKRAVKAIGRQVEEQPLVSLLLAFAVGFLGGRMLSR
jgi:ElaB/YqjD/DUF883 family membrane-anchored ribosome-binding protein